MTEGEWRLILTPGMSIGLLKRLLDRFGSPEEVLALPFEELASHLGKSAASYIRFKSDKRTQEILRWAEKREISLLPFTSVDYPKGLLPFEESPTILFLDGDSEVLGKTSIGVVGTRRATHYGMSQARWFSCVFQEAGVVVVSGGARGIDKEAHLGALERGGRTISILGNGLDRVYPKEHRRLFERIRERGAILTEFPPGTPPFPWNFPRRNRIITGISKALLVIEAPIRSGAIITAGWAARQGKEVFVIPGEITRDSYEGNHFLIKSGAQLVTSPYEVLEELEIQVKELRLPEERADLDGEELEILSLLGDEPTPLDLILEGSSLDMNLVLSHLVLLEMKGVVKSLPGGSYIRIRAGC